MPSDQTNVVDLILQDHRELERLFDELRTQPEKRRSLVPVMATLLYAHSRAEEGEVYPSAREAGASEDVEHSQKEHLVADELAARLGKADPGSSEFDDLLGQLIDAVKHHLEEEEEDLLPHMRDRMDADELDRLGRAFLAAREANLGGQQEDITKAELEQQAQNIDLEGRSEMSRDELADKLSDEAELLTADVVVIGGGPNGLVAANALVDAGWDVVLVEAADQVGGAVRSAEVTAPGFVNDLFSAFYPLAAASPVIRGLELERHGLAWSHAESVLAHQFDDGTAAVLSRDPDVTAASVDAFGEGDGDAWLRMFAHWQRVRDPLLDALFTPFPPVAPGLRLARRLGAAGLLDFARLAVLPVRRLGQEQFTGRGAPALLTGNALHSDVPPEAAGSGVFGWLLAMLGQDIGFPVPRGGAQALSDALAARITAGGGQVLTSSRVESVEITGGRAVGVRLTDGTRIGVRRGVLADVDAPTLYRELVGARHLPPGLLTDLDRFQWDHPTLKLNWALREPIGWLAKETSGAGTVHLGVDLDGFVDFAADLTTGRAPRKPFVLFGQMTTADATRSPAGTESAWAYSHLPRDLLVGTSPSRAESIVNRQATRMIAAIEKVAPGFGDLVLAEHRQSPADLQAADSNLVVGALNGGTSGLHQQLFFRPTPGLGRPETPIEGLYLASASAHPGGGVHGACGWNAARAALAAHGPTGTLRRRLAHTAWARLLGGG